MDVYDTLNQRFGSGTVFLVEQGGNRRSANAASDVNAAIYDPLGRFTEDQVLAITHSTNRCQDTRVY